MNSGTARVKRHGDLAGQAGRREGQLNLALNVRRERAFQDPGNALQQARRGTFDPGYLNYTLGKLMIMKLRSDWMAQRGKGASLREFHDTLLGYGEPPIPLARRYMLGEAYTGDTQLLP